MSKEKDTLYKHHYEAEQKYDYFIVGLAGAMFAYIVQTYVPAKIEFSPSVLEPVSLILLGFAFFVGLKRIEQVKVGVRLNHEYLNSKEQAKMLTNALQSESSSIIGSESGEPVSKEEISKRKKKHLERIDQCSEGMKRNANASERTYRIRNYLVMAGFGSIFLAKVLQPYFQK